LAAGEAGDPAVASWVRAQDAYTYYYGGSVPEAIVAAQEAQALAGRSPCVGARAGGSAGGVRASAPEQHRAGAWE